MIVIIQLIEYYYGCESIRWSRVSRAKRRLASGTMLFTTPISLQQNIHKLYSVIQIQNVLCKLHEPIHHLVAQMNLILASLISCV